MLIRFFLVLFLRTFRITMTGVFFIFCLYQFLAKYLFFGISLGSYLFFDSISLGIIVLTLITVMFIMLAGYFERMNDNNWVKLLVLMLFLLGSLVVTFSTSSFICFYLFFEFGVMPIFIIIIRVGYRFNRVQAAIYMFIYTFLASLPILIFLLYFYYEGVSFVFFLEFGGCYKQFFQYWWLFFILVFMVKLPLFVLHLWLPKAHVDAPLLGSMVLAGVLLKLGGYGFYKSLIFLFSFIRFLSFFLVSFSLVGSVLVGVLCLSQVDIKSTIAYSSVVHIGPVFCSLCLTSYYGLLGAYWIIVSHGFCSACLFYILDVFYKSTGSRSFFLLRGSSFYLSVFSLFWFRMCLMNIGFPPSFNFFSEVFIFVRMLSFSFVTIIVLFFLGLIGGLYRVFMYSFLRHGKTISWNLGFRFLKLRDFLLLTFSSFLLLFFLFYIICFSYFFSLHKILACGVNEV